MINVSNEYKEAINRSLIKSAVSGVLTTSDKRSYNITERNIVAGTLKINNQCVNSEFSFGSVYVGQCKIELYLDAVRYSLDGAKIELWQDFELAEGRTERIPLGIYFVNEASRTRKTVALKCYDGMTFFDKLLEYSANGNAYEFYKFACDRCGVELGSSVADISSLPNANLNLYLDTEHLTTYRDLLSQVSRIQGAFCTMGRDGKLYVKSLGNKASVRTIPESKRVKSTIYDYQSFYNGITARFIANENYYPYTERSSATGILIDLGDIPIVRGLESTKKQVIHEIVEVSKDIRYTPCKMNIVPDASLEVGDYIVIENANNSGENVKSLITEISWENHGKMSIVSKGKNGLLENIKTQQEKDISQAEAKSTDVFSALTMINVRRIESDATYQELGRVNFISKGDGNIIFNGVVKLISADVGSVDILYNFNGIEQDFIHSYIIPKGIHTITLFIPLLPMGGVANQLRVYIRTFGTVCTVYEGDFRGAVYGSGLNTMDWDGIISCDDAMPLFALGTYKARVMDDSVNLRIIDVDKSTIMEMLRKPKIESYKVEEHTEDMSITFEINSYNRHMENGEERMLEGTNIIRRTKGGFIDAD